MKIIGIENLSDEELSHELQRGGRFVCFEYCISIIIMTFKRSSPVYFIKGGDSVVGKSLGFSMISLITGWWGFPWGPIYTIGSVVTNLKGGRDLTRDLVSP